jgi:hypothetical protein
VSAVAERVAAGAAFLDEHDPEWWRADVERAIDLETLDIRSDNLCLLGQRCPLEASPTRSAYNQFATLLSGVGNIWSVDLWARPFGFQADAPGGAGFDDLTDEWKRVITGRRAAS